MLAMSRVGNTRLREAGAVGGSLGLSGVSAALGACCAGSWAVALFGMSGAVAIARWEAYRLYLLIPATALLAWAMWRERRLPGRRLWIRSALGAALVALIASAFVLDAGRLFARLE
jgi:hypothetical protein